MVKKKLSRVRVIPKKPAVRKRPVSDCSRLEEEIERLIRESPGKKASIDEICKAMHISEKILIHHVRVRNEKGLVHLEEYEGEIGLDTVISIIE